ncbi:MAG: glycosyltransferase family 4 protein [Mobilicoccus sp.]|nr:glycosyltransferase family 4 protein [Mobilicoccus sp.]
MMRVLQVSARYLPDLGGIETHVAEVSRRLAERDDVEVTVATTDVTQTYPRRDRIEGVDVMRVPAYPRGRDYYYAPGLAGIIARGDWDVVHVQGVHTLVPVVAMAAARRARVPYVTSFHTGGHSLSHRNAMRSTQWRVLGPLLRRAAALIGVSRFEADLVGGAARVAVGGVEVVRNGGGLPMPDPVHAIVPGRIVSSGRLVPYKGHQRVIAALPEVMKQVPEAHVRILGGGDVTSNEADLRALAERLGVADRVAIDFLPPGERLTMACALREAAVVAAFSEYEAHPVAVMEALSVGARVVGTDIAGIGELVDEGWVAPVAPDASPQTAAEAIVRAMDGERLVDPDELPTWEGCTAALVEIYRRVTRR